MHDLQLDGRTGESGTIDAALGGIRHARSFRTDTLPKLGLRGCLAARWPARLPRSRLEIISHIGSPIVSERLSSGPSRRSLGEPVWRQPRLGYSRFLRGARRARISCSGISILVGTSECAARSRRAGGGALPGIAADHPDVMRGHPVLVLYRGDACPD